MEIERRGIRSLSVENSLWKRKWTRRETDCRINYHVTYGTIRTSGD
jgi:hypothetical protein